VDGIVRAAQTERAACRTYFLAGERPVQWKELGAHMSAAIGRRTAEVNLPRWVVAAISTAGEVAGRVAGTAMLANSSKAALGRDPYWVCSAARARAELGFREEVTLPVGIRETYLWYVTHRWLRARGV
jgi:nucleoside-diphosphate-sugar epimerase